MMNIMLVKRLLQILNNFYNNIGVFFLESIYLRYNGMLNSNLSYFSQQFSIWVQDQMEFEFGDGKYQMLSTSAYLMQFSQPRM
jgi:hypothetical protein